MQAEEDHSPMLHDHADLVSSCVDSLFPLKTPQPHSPAPQYARLGCQSPQSPRGSLNPPGPWPFPMVAALCILHEFHRLRILRVGSLEQEDGASWSCPSNRSLRFLCRSVPSAIGLRVPCLACGWGGVKRIKGWDFKFCLNQNQKKKKEKKRKENK